MIVAFCKITHAMLGGQDGCDLLMRHPKLSLIKFLLETVILAEEQDSLACIFPQSSLKTLSL